MADRCPVALEVMTSIFTGEADTNVGFFVPVKQLFHLTRADAINMNFQSEKSDLSVISISNLFRDMTNK